MRIYISNSGEETCPATLSEIMNVDYYPIWEKVCKQECRLATLQDEIVKLLPGKKHDLRYYITLRALYLFARDIWSKLYELCDRLTDSPKNEDAVTESELKSFLDKLESVGLEALLDADEENALGRLADIVWSMSHDVVAVVGNWSLRDIIGTNDFSNDPTLLSSVSSAEDFTEVSIGKISADNKTKRVY